MIVDSANNPLSFYMRIGGIDMSEVNEAKDVTEKAIDIELTDEQLDAILDELEGGSTIEDVTDELFNERIIYLQGEVSEDVSNQIIPLIHYYNIQDDKNEVELEQRQPIQIFIDSEGGELYKGFSILSAIERSKTPIWTYLEGSIGMSMSFVLFLSGEKRFMSRFGNLLFHELRGGSDVKTLAEMKNMIQHYSNLQEKMDKYIVERTNIPMKRLKNQRKKNLDWYIDYDTAERYGVFTDTI